MKKRKEKYISMLNHRFLVTFKREDVHTVQLFFFIDQKNIKLKTKLLVKYYIFTNQKRVSPPLELL